MSIIDPPTHQIWNDFCSWWQQSIVSIRFNRIIIWYQLLGIYIWLVPSISRTYTICMLPYRIPQNRRHPCSHRRAAANPNRHSCRISTVGWPNRRCPAKRSACAQSSTAKHWWVVLICRATIATILIEHVAFVCPSHKQPDPRVCHDSLMDQIKRGSVLNRNKSVNDRSAPKIYK